MQRGSENDRQVPNFLHFVSRSLHGDHSLINLILFQLMIHLVKLFPAFGAVDRDPYPFALLILYTGHSLML